MKKLTSIILILFLSLLSSPSWSETLTMDDLVQRDGLYYKKFTNVPFTGEISGKKQGSIKNGMRTGKWVKYYKNGQLAYKGEYKDGKEVGEWVGYWDNGQLAYKGEYKDGMRTGKWVKYYKNGYLEEKGEYKDGKFEGEWVSYNIDGTIESKKTY